MTMFARSSGRCFTTIYQNLNGRHTRAYQNGCWHIGRRFVSSWASLSNRAFAALEDRLVAQVGASVKDPILETDLKSLGWIQRRLNVCDDGSLGVSLKLPTLLHPQRDALVEQVTTASLKELESIAQEKGIDDVSASISVEVSAAPTVPIVARRQEEHDEIIRNLGPGLAKVAHFLAVYSCKGGVGKSTIAVNLAYEMARMGGRIGLLDVDIYGPSLPTLIHPDDATVRRSPLGKGMVFPIEYKGVKVLSLGFVSPDVRTNLSEGLIAALHHIEFGNLTRFSISTEWCPRERSRGRSSSNAGSNGWPRCDATVCPSLCLLRASLHS